MSRMVAKDNAGNIRIVNFYLFIIQMVGYSDSWYHLNDEQVKVHYSDVSNIQIPIVHQISISIFVCILHVPLFSARLPTFFNRPPFPPPEIVETTLIISYFHFFNSDLGLPSFCVIILPWTTEVISVSPLSM